MNRCEVTSELDVCWVVGFGPFELTVTDNVLPMGQSVESGSEVGNEEKPRQSELI